MLQCIELNKESYHRLIDWSSARGNDDDTSYVTDLLASCAGHDDTNTLHPMEVTWIPQGCATCHAQVGLYELAQELDEFIRSSKLPGPWKVWIGFITEHAYTDRCHSYIRLIDASDTVM